jgi:peptidoglycan/LPS O-acetylase OafA/YrhL
MQLIYVAALAGLLAALAMRAAKGARVTFVLAVLVGVAVNAIVSGAISGVFDRYQGRVAWLVPLALAVLMAPRREGEERAAQ